MTQNQTAKSARQELLDLGTSLDQMFLGRSETIRLMLVSAVAGEHLLLIGPPGTAKSALIREFAKGIDAVYFEYLLTRFTEPNEIFGPIDIESFRQGKYERRTEGMLPASEVVFLDEVFKASSAILNSLLSVLNERVYSVGGKVHRVPLISAFGASNEVPNDEELSAVFDRFLLRVRTDSLESFQFTELLRRGADIEKRKSVAAALPVAHASPKEQVLSATLLRETQRQVAAALPTISESFLAEYKGAVFQLRAEGISFSDRRAVKVLKLFMANAWLDGRKGPDAADLLLLRHVWNSPEQSELLETLLDRLVEPFLAEHPERQVVFTVAVDVPALEKEVERIRQILGGGEVLSDLQLFTQMKTLGEIRSRLATLRTEQARTLSGKIDRLLGQAFDAGTFGG